MRESVKDIENGNIYSLEEVLQGAGKE